MAWDFLGNCSSWGKCCYRAYKRAQKVYEGMENDPRYAHRANHGDKSLDDDEDK